MAAAGIERAVQVGWSTGCQVVLETYRHAPERCEALVKTTTPA
jgi:pimeloyl-ACP methyl ester carboxylesterase